METIIETIRTAIASDASDEARTAGVQACRTLLAALETPTGTAMLAAPTAPNDQPPSPIQFAISALRGMSPDQLLDLGIARLRAALPPGARVESPQPLRFQLLPLGALGAKP